MLYTVLIRTIELKYDDDNDSMGKIRSTRMSSTSRSSSDNDNRNNNLGMVLATFFWYNFRQYFILNQRNDIKFMWEEKRQNCFHSVTNATSTPTSTPTPTPIPRWRHPSDGDTESRYDIIAYFYYGCHVVFNPHIILFAKLLTSLSNSKSNDNNKKSGKDQVK